MADYSATIEEITSGGLRRQATEKGASGIIGAFAACLAALRALVIPEADGLERENRPLDPFTSAALTSGQVSQFPLL